VSQNAVGDFQVVQAASAFDTIPNKKVTISCPNGLRATAVASPSYPERICSSSGRM
jgi:hypothetical protein